LATAICLGTCWMPAVASADGKEQASQHFQRAVELLRNRQVREALAEFRLAYGLRPHYSVLFNIAQAHAELGEAVEAVETLGRYLDEGREAISQERRVEVGAKVRQLETRIGLVDIQTSLPGATVSVDGKNVGSSPFSEPFRMNAGAHLVTASHPGYLTAQARAMVSGQQVTTVVLTLITDHQPDLPRSATPAPPATAPAQTSRPETKPGRPEASQGPDQRSLGRGSTSGAATPSRTGKLQRGIGHGLSASGLLGVGAGVAFIVQASENDAESKRHCGVNGDPMQCDALGVRANNQAIQASERAILGFVLGGAALAGGVILILTAPSRTPSSSGSAAAAGWPWLAVGPRSLAVRGAW
jgi:hypothetical protein